MTDLLSRLSSLPGPSETLRPVRRNLPGAGHEALLASGLPALGLAAADLLLGASCHSCGQPGIGVCAGCRDSVADRVAFLTSPSVVASGQDALTVAASSSYDPILRQLISAHKDRQAWQLSRFLGDRLALAIQHLLAELDGEHTELVRAAGGCVALVPVPSTAAAVRARGRDATAALAARAAGRLEFDCDVVKALRQVRPVAEQSGLDARQRRRNLDGALGARARRTERLRLARTPVVIIDDLQTTGATLAESARALRAAGVEVLGAAVVAATLRRHPVSSS